MKPGTAKVIRTILLVVSCFVFLYGLGATWTATRAAATDKTKIKIEFTEKNRWYDPNESPYINGCYHVEYTINIKNDTRVNWYYLDVLTHVCDKSGRELGTIMSSFGSYSYSSSSMILKPGETTARTCEIKDNQPDDFFKTLYNSDLSDLVFTSEVTNGNYN